MKFTSYIKEFSIFTQMKGSNNNMHKTDIEKNKEKSILFPNN